MVGITTSMRAQKFRHNYHKDYLAMKRGTYDYSKIYRVFHKHGTILDSGWYDTQTWGSLHKAWIGYVIAKNKGEYDQQIQYASIIQKLQKELNLEVSSFPQLGRPVECIDNTGSEFDNGFDQGYHDGQRDWHGVNGHGFDDSINHRSQSFQNGYKATKGFNDEGNNIHKTTC
jgi:hypothetical protein